MKRYAQEKHIIERRNKLRVAKGHPAETRSKGRLRKATAFGHYCLMCRFERVYGIPTLKNRKDDLSFREQLCE